MLKPAYTRLVSKIVRFRVAVVMSLCLLMVALAIAVIPITRGQKIGADEASGRPVPPRISSILAPGVLSLPGTLKPVVTTSVGSGVSQVVRGLPLTKPLQGPPWTGDAPLPLHPPHGLPSLPVQDPVQQTSAASLAMPAANQTFDGMSQGDACGNCIPPDPNGAVGPNHYVEMVNSSFAVYSKTGTKLSGPTDINSLFQGLPATAPCRLYNDGDPVVVYDHLADRWVLSQFAVNGGNGPYDECIAVSSTSDPTGSYFVYDFHRSDTIFHDYPKLGVWPDGYYLTTNEFDHNNNDLFVGAGVAALERDKMLAGDPGARMVFFDLSTVNSGFGGMLPSTVDGAPPPTGAPNYFAEVDSQLNTPSLGADAMRIWKFHVDWTNPANSTFGIDGLPDSTLPVASWVPAQCIEGQGTCVPQEGSPYGLDVLGDRIMFRLTYRNFGDHESLLVNHSVLADARIGVRWYEVRGLSSTPTIFQQSTFAPTDALWRWMGSLAMDHSGDIAVGYSTSSPSSFPSIAFAGRLANDPIGQLSQGEAQLFAGTGPENVAFYLPPVGRWGDYSALTVDPTDDCTFWYVNEYFNDFPVEDPGAPWRTRIGSFRFPQCVASSSTPTPTATPTPAPTPTSTPTPTPTPNPGVLPAPQDLGPKVGFQNYEAPGTLISVTSSSQGPSAKTVEYLGHDAGEPSVGNNWKSNVMSYQSDLQTLFVSFNDNCPATGQPVTWVNRPAPTSQFVDSDPIGFTDRYTGRTFAGELTLTSPTCKTSFSDDDGQTWIPALGFGLGASVDHETIGGGPFHAPLTRPTNMAGLYPDAVYYCSQLPAASCSRSDDGGLTFGPSVEVDPVADAHCGGLHGHIKVAPDGTVCLPMNDCDHIGSVIVSSDNGVTWTIRHVPGTVSEFNSKDPNSSGLQDPAVGVDTNGRAYFVIASMGNTDPTSGAALSSAAVVATSDDQGQTWQNVYDVGAIYGLKNIAYPAAVAADAGRAAVAFYGTTATGDESANGFTGSWHLYVAETFDGGAHWTTTDATPNMPIQRGCIWMHGGANICRNLLDFFDMTVDRDGRVEVGYVNGCAGGNCAQAASNATGNAYTATATIARQSSGRRLVALNGPANATTVPGMVSVTTRRVGNVVHLGWSEADTGSSAIVSYKIMRGIASGGETLL